MCFVYMLFFVLVSEYNEISNSVSGSIKFRPFWAKNPGLFPRYAQIIFTYPTFYIYCILEIIYENDCGLIHRILG